MAIWYLWARNNDPATNEYLAHVIGEQNPECEHRDMLCADEKRRNLWECPAGYENVRTATAALSKFSLKLEVFKQNREGKFADMVIRFDLWKAESRKAVCASIQDRSQHHRGWH